VSPYRADRERVRLAHELVGLPFVEVFVDTPLAECERRDPKGLYREARAGHVVAMTGIDDPYESPLRPEIALTPATVAEQAASVVSVLGHAVPTLAGDPPRSPST
jgi:bifunctional enzyme CysN/CysC